MKSLKLGVSLLLFSGASCAAADLLPTKSSLVDRTLPRWTGVYVGLNAGYGFGASNNAQNYGWANPNFFQNSINTVAYASAASSMGRGIFQSGFIGGGQIGYNYQLRPATVLGVEADIQGSGVRGTGSANGLAPISSNSLFTNHNIIQAGVDWLGTVRGRIGYNFTQQGLVYVTGGFAYGGSYLNTFPLTATAQLVGPLQGAFGSGYLTTQNSGNRILVGWTSGVGSELMLAPNWSLKAEALYYDLGSQSASNLQYSGYAQLAGSNPVGGSTTSAYYKGLLARTGLNYHFNAGNISDYSSLFLDRQTPSTTESVKSNWSNFHVGLNAGYGFGISSNAQNYGWGNPAPGVFFQNPTSSLAYAAANSALAQGVIQNGFIGGGEFGYNYQLKNDIVLGLETDIQGTGIRGTGSAYGYAPVSSPSIPPYIPAGISNLATSYIIQAGIDWIGTTRGQIGYLVSPTHLLYITGGAAYGGAYLNTFITPEEFYQGANAVSSLALSTQNSKQNVLFGWAAGAGTEWLFMSNWSIKAEALFYNLGRISVSNTQYLGYSAYASINPLSGSITKAYYNGVLSRVGVNYHFNFSAAPVVAKF